MTAALYTYLYSAFMLPVAGTWLLLLWWLGRGRAGNHRRFLLGIASLAIVSALFLPFALAAWRVSGAEAVHGHAFQGMFPVLPVLLRVYAVNLPHWPDGWLLALTVGLGALALAGLLWPGERGNKEQGHAGPLAAIGNREWGIGNSGRGEGEGEQGAGGGSRPAGRALLPIPYSLFPKFPMPAGSVWLALWLGVVILCGGILLGRESRMFAETRYQIALAPALCLLWGRALAGLWRWRRAAGWIGAAALVGVMLLALPWDWRPENRREDWRDAAAFIDQGSGKNDAVVVQPDYIHPALDRYLSAAASEMFFPFTDVIRDPAKVDPPLAGLVGYNAVWLVQSHYEKLDPQNLVAGWFSHALPRDHRDLPDRIVIHEYLQHYRMAALPAGVPRVDATLGGLRLLSCAYTARGAARPPRRCCTRPAIGFMWRRTGRRRARPRAVRCRQRGSSMPRARSGATGWTGPATPITCGRRRAGSTERSCGRIPTST